MPNKNGFEPGQMLTFEQVMQVQRQERAKPMGGADAMSKGDVRKRLEALGVKVERGATVAQMRAELQRVMEAGE